MHTGHYYAAPFLRSPQLSHFLESEWVDVAPIALLNRNSEEVNAHDCEAARSVHDFYLKKKDGPKQQQQQDNSDNKGEATARAFGDAFCVGGDIDVDDLLILPNAYLDMSLWV